MFFSRKQKLYKKNMDNYIHSYLIIYILFYRDTLNLSQNSN